MSLFIPGGSSQAPFHLQWDTYHPSWVQNEAHQIEMVVKHLTKFSGPRKSSYLLSHQGDVQAYMASIFQQWMNAKTYQWHWRFPRVSLHIQCPHNSLKTSGPNDNHIAWKRKPFHHQCSVCSVIKLPDHDGSWIVIKINISMAWLFYQQN